MNFILRSIVATAVSTFLLGFAPAFIRSQAAPAPQAPSTLQFPADEVLLDLVVQDRRDRPIVDLQPEQIFITDNGAPVKLTSLRLVTGSHADPSLIALLFDRPGIAGKQEATQTDAIGMPATSVQELTKGLREAAQNLLKPFPQAGFQFAVLDVWGRLEMQQAYTADRKAVARAIVSAAEPGQYGVKATPPTAEARLAAVAKTGQDSSGVAIGAAERTLARSLNSAIGDSGRIVTSQHLSASLASLLALVESMQSLPGRKAVVYFTIGGGAQSGLHNDSASKNALQSILGAANRAGVSIYVVRVSDLAAAHQLSSIMNGYDAMSLGADDVQRAPSTNAAGVTTSGYTLAKSAMFGGQDEFRQIASAQSGQNGVHDALDGLATGTGGVSVAAGEDLAKPAKELVRDLSTYYEASYAPPAGLQDGSFHSTGVKVLRAGLKVRARSGYLALPRNAGITEPPQPFEVPLMALLARPAAPADVNFRATVIHIGHQEEGDLSLVAVQVPVDNIETREDSSTHLVSAHVSVLANIKDNTGSVIEHFSEDMPARWSSANGATARPQALSFDRPFSAPAGDYTLEAALLDSNSGKAAVVRQPFTIEPATAVPELSQLVLVRAIEPAPATATDADPLAFGDKRVEPDLYGELPAGTQKVSVFFMAHTDPASKDPASVKLEVLRGGTPLPGAALESNLQAGSEFHPVVNSFSFRSAPAGGYELRATITQGAKSAASIAYFNMAGDSAGDADTAATIPVLDDPTNLKAAASPASHLAPEEIDQILADARKYSVDYAASLPNLICQQVTSRSQDDRGDGKWKHTGSTVEMLTYVDHDESRTVLGGEQFGSTKDSGHARQNGMNSAGEFGEALGGIFKPASMAEFTWKESATISGQPVEVFEYRIDRANSTFSLHSPSGYANVGYHGRIYVDRATRGVRSFTMLTDEAPKDFAIRRAAVRIDYDYVSINDHDYLVPISAEVVVSEGKQLLERNQLEFSGFRRFGSKVRIVGDDPDAKAK
jgi:VWFA-related protein